VRLACHRPRLDAGHVLAAGQRQQPAGLGRVDEPVGLDRDGAVGPVEGHRPHALPVDVGAGRGVLHQARDRPQHGLQHGQGCARLAAERAHASRAGVERRARASLRRERVMGAVVRTDALAQRAVARRASEALDPRVLVGRHGLRGELAADPVALLGQNHAAPGTACRERRGDAAEAAAHDQDLGPHRSQSVP
jgi:hypothetical protein